jgi:hypothetical protein
MQYLPGLYHFEKSEPDPNQRDKLDPDQHQSQKWVPDPHQSQNSGAMGGGLTMEQ